MCHPEREGHWVTDSQEGDIVNRLVYFSFKTDFISTNKRKIKLSIIHPFLSGLVPSFSSAQRNNNKKER